MPQTGDAVVAAARRGPTVRPVNFEAWWELAAASVSAMLVSSTLTWRQRRRVLPSPAPHGKRVVVQFARGNGLSVRGHTLVWYAALPPWTAGIGSRAEAEAELVAHIRQTVTRYAGAIPSWDVVNEPIPDRPTSVRDLRESIWTKQIGPDYIPLAFRTAHACDPSARLFINDYDIEFEGARFQAKRDAFLDLLRRLKDDNVPVHGVGMQAHLIGSRAIDRGRLGDFLRAVHGLGLDI